MERKIASFRVTAPRAWTSWCSRMGVLSPCVLRDAELSATKCFLTTLWYRSRRASLVVGGCTSTCHRRKTAIAVNRMDGKTRRWSTMCASCDPGGAMTLRFSVTSSGWDDPGWYHGLGSCGIMGISAGAGALWAPSPPVRRSAPDRQGIDPDAATRWSDSPKASGLALATVHPNPFGVVHGWRQTTQSPGIRHPCFRFTTCRGSSWPCGGRGRAARGPRGSCGICVPGPGGGFHLEHTSCKSGKRSSWAKAGGRDQVGGRAQPRPDGPRGSRYEVGDEAGFGLRVARKVEECDSVPPDGALLLGFQRGPPNGVLHRTREAISIHRQKRRVSAWSIPVCAAGLSTQALEGSLHTDPPPRPQPWIEREYW